MEKHGIPWKTPWIKQFVRQHRHPTSLCPLVLLGGVESRSGLRGVGFNGTAPSAQEMEELTVETCLDLLSGCTVWRFLSGGLGLPLVTPLKVQVFKLFETVNLWKGSYTLPIMDASTRSLPTPHGSLQRNYCRVIMAKFLKSRTLL